MSRRVNGARHSKNLVPENSKGSELKEYYAKCYIVESYLVAEKVADKLRVLAPGVDALQWAMKILLAFFLLFAATEILVVPNRTASPAQTTPAPPPHHPTQGDAVSTKSHLFTDADNTLWDTDGVFAAAQLEMLREVERITGRIAPDDDDRGLAFLRNLDQRIAASHPDHLQYPPKLLAHALAQVLEGRSVEEVVAMADRGAESSFEQAQAQFLDSVRRLPPLREGVREGLLAISSARIPITVVTEERLERCRKFLVGHRLDSVITDAVSLRKTTDAYLALKVEAQCDRCFMIGEGLSRFGLHR
jgi:putative hydrolase of the HAD superfamily